MSSDGYKHPLIAVADEHLDKTLDRFDKGIEPIWQEQLESIKNIVTLSSSALVLSVTATQLLAGRVSHPRWLWLLPTAWLLFVVALALGGGNYTWLAATRTARLRFELQRGDIRGKLLAIVDTEDLSERADAIFAEALASAWGR